MQPHLAKFLENNDSPSHEVLKEIRDLLLKPLQELQDKDAEIERLTQALDDLKEERNGIRKSIDEYATILSPIRRIPSDIMHEIFYHCLPTHRNPIMSITEAPLLLTRICQPWRFIAMSFHRIWSKLYIPVIPYSADASPYPHPPGPNSTMARPRVSQRESGEKFARMMAARCKLVDIWLSRSGSCSLSLSLNFLDCSDRIWDNDRAEGSPWLQVFNIFAAFSPRCIDLELSMPSEFYEIFQNRLSLNMVPRLRNLKMSMYEPSNYTRSQKRSVTLLQAPTLQSFSLSVENLVAFDSGTIPSTWKNLTNIAFHSDITGEEAVQVVRRCQNLEHCKLTISAAVDVYVGPEEALLLPRLRSLSIHVVGMDMMALFYKRINAAILNSFEYHNQSLWQQTSESVPIPLPSSPILSLLKKCNRIKKLSLDLHMLNAQDTLFSFRFANQITHLILGQRPLNGSRGGFYRQPRYQKPDFGLDLLILGGDASSDPSVQEKEILLPKLEVFEAYGSPTNFSDEALQRFILGRLGNPARKEVSKLRSVRVKFDRRREMDIKEEVYRRAKEAGVEIEIDLSYLAEPELANVSKYTNIFLPWYGLTASDRSWNFVDIETEGS